MHLRTRVFWITALNAAMLLAIVFVLTVRARDTEREMARLLQVESKGMRQLDELARLQVGYAGLWRGLTPASPAPSLAARYRSVEQASGALAGDATAGAMRDRVTTFAALVATVESDWQTATPAERAALLEAIGAESRSVSDAASSLARQRETEIERSMFRLTRGGSMAMWTGLGVAWIIAVISFFVAKITLTKVVRPIEQLSSAAGRLAAGDRAARAPVAGDAEIAQLGRSFNGMAEHLAQLLGNLEQSASTDELTALPNFRSFRMKIDEEIERASRYGTSFGVLVLDLDRFKKYNDRFGHLAGNEALRAVAETLGASIRSVDFAARYGGEEFAVVLPQIAADGTIALAERIRKAIERIPPFEGRPRITVSIGAAVFPDDGGTAEELFAAADARLYEAKAAGRNRVVGPAVGVGASEG